MHACGMMLFALEERQGHRPRSRRQNPAHSIGNLFEKGLVLGDASRMDVMTRNSGNSVERRICRSLSDRKLPVLKGLPEGSTEPCEVD